jgi:hypothetical protein
VRPVINALAQPSEIIRELVASSHQSALAPWIDQAVATFATGEFEVMTPPFMNQIATLPLASCQRMSLLPSPSKSPGA